MKLIFVNRYFHPDLSATSQMLSDLAFHLAARGREVHVVTSRQRYDDAAARLAAIETRDGVRIHRVWTSRFGRGWLPGRALDYFSFYVAAAIRIARLAGNGDLVIAMTDPPLVSFPSALAARLRGARLVNWLQDVFPEIAAQLGMRAARGPLGALARWARGYSLRAAALNVVLGERMREVVARLEPGCRGRLAVIHNWADGKALHPLPPGARSLRAEWGFEGKFVVAYSGNMGRVHDFDTLLAACERLRAQADIRFLFIGDGYHRPRLEQEVRRRDLLNVTFQPYQARGRLAESMGAADAHLVSLLPALEGLVVPSKFYGIAAAGRPAIFVGDPEGEIARILRDNHCGLVVAAGDGKGLADAILALRDKPALRAEMGANARAAFEARYDRAHAMTLWESALERARL